MKRLMELRESRGISKYALAKQLGISDVAVLRLEQGRSNPSVDLLKRIADYFEVTTDYLLNDDYESDGDIPAVQAAEQETENLFSKNGS